MHTQYKISKDNACANGSLLDPQDGQRSVANASRLVIRDKRANQEPHPAVERYSFPARDTETVTLRAGRNGQGTVVFHPIPSNTSCSSVAHVDWLGFTLSLAEERVRSWLFKELVSVFRLPVSEIKKSGWNGYTQCAKLGDFGIVAWGGKAQRGTVHVEINGTGCARIADWAKVQAWGAAQNAWITRIDLAHDDLDGAQCNVQQVLAWHEQRGFNCGGRDAKVKLAGDWHDLTDGRTIYIGTRGNKMLRCYEKGKQLGDSASDWFRVELELRNKNRHLPWDMLTRPGQYLAGAYPCLGFLAVEQVKLRTMQKATAMSLDRMTANASRLSGKAINVLMKVHQGDARKVVQLLRRKGIPKRLIPYQDQLANPRTAGGTNEDA
ncbi:replication initiation factor domain-containing protein [Noviherbaspirillum autotrophicum]|uniref:replication initiation factor domain-containing protein n=1 Tax=Noviherbaspirillum autotrophicum TaxID=709839 RepID=UPI000693A753|nr:replication initiation factor domain-containing protein [Noviherbaspirillum autotrophicum]